ncbi:lipid phosphate phosphatase epsilon 2, chloroplastic [Alnus glutinosa]|uniref:lipid phosphate phosphatase epsilon 2, chloroplastic n=1 Tax=Alnus glutinosa TaxID=3517 RepID=UPI002D76B21E|nr:lipid phosphate phosphatase epsilon 2, chloroplastic [Alnus glutinosa]
MIPTLTVLRKPSFGVLPSDRPMLKSINSTFSVDLSLSNSSFFGGFVSTKGVCERNRVQGLNKMVKASAFKRGDGDEGVRVLQQETFVDGSPKFRRELMADGLEPTLNRMSKWLVAGLFGGVILWRHDAVAIWAAMGSVLNSMLSIILKRILNQERPVSTLRSDPGMPSTHSQSIFFTVAFTIVSIMEWLGMNEFSITISGLTLAFGSYLSWLRVSQQFHTVNQVVVGAILGSIFSILWSWSWDAVVLQAFISSFWVRTIVVLGAAGFCLGFLVYVVLNWFRDEDQFSK